VKNTRENKRLYTPSETAEKLDIATGLLNKWILFFEVETEWTKEGKTGHRRYTAEQLEVLLKIKEKVQDLNWSWGKTKAWLNGDETVNPVLKTSIEAKMDKQAELIEQLIEINQTLASQITKLNQYIEQELIAGAAFDFKEAKFKPLICGESTNEKRENVEPSEFVSEEIPKSRSRKEREFKKCFFSFFGFKKG
jgi:DNA-binding transcriptional MerR regulator